MCGIVGYIGSQQATSILMDGLARLEYRGYDSAGLAVHDGDGIHIHRAAGKLSALRSVLAQDPLMGTCGIGHTRWATHGAPSEQNAHPHAWGKVVVVHNGILENHAQLRKELQELGHGFSSQTDTEILAHLIDDELQSSPLPQAVIRALSRVNGTYAVAVMCQHHPDQLVVAKNASPLVLGLGDGENLIASDIPALLAYTQDVVFLEDEELALVTADKVEIQKFSGELVQRNPRRVTWTPMMAEKGGHKHFMHKEIHEQPRALADTLAGRLNPDHCDVSLDLFRMTDADIRKLRRVVLVACGTSWHASLVGKFLIEGIARIPVETDLASEFRYRQPLVNEHDLVVAISQSGETADTLAAIHEAKSLGANLLAICNVLDSSIPRACKHALYTHAGPEIGVASTKAFTTQIAALVLLAVRLARAQCSLDDLGAKRILDGLSAAPEVLEKALLQEQVIAKVAKTFSAAGDFLYVARGINYPIALEGALKLKEISYIHAEGYPAGELKHGPIALIDEHMPVVAIATSNRSYEKVLSNLAEIRARDGKIIAICNEPREDIKELAQYIIQVPRTLPELEPLINVLPLQLLAYHVADFNGTDVDQPRNLAKSVTVE